MQHDARVRQRRAFPLGAAREQHPSHRARGSEPDASDVALDVLHRVQDGHRRDDLAALAVDVQVDVFPGFIRGVQVEHRRDELVPELVVDLLADPHDALAVEAVPDVDPLPRVFVRGLVRDARDADGHHRRDGPRAFAVRPRLRAHRVAQRRDGFREPDGRSLEAAEGRHLARRRRRRRSRGRARRRRELARADADGRDGRRRGGDGERHGDSRLSIDPIPLRTTDGLFLFPPREP
mmetsp:Transcript_3156/g.10564  ORF Transcript_3156/g.10564 Transcript_3156/m.10564 type:complete len:236 (+) Transcript_3156:414-1121(+)